MVPNPAPSPLPARLPAEERRRQITQIAVDLFSRKGFSGTTTKEIAAAAGITEAIIFRHFATKQALYNAIIDERLDASRTREWLAEYAAIVERKDDEALFRILVTAIIEMCRQDPAFERLMMFATLEGHEMAQLYHDRFALPFVDKLRDYIASRQAEGAILGTDPALVIAAAAGMAKTFAQHKYLCPMKKDSTSDADAVATFTRILMRGVCAPKNVSAQHGVIPQDDQQ